METEEGITPSLAISVLHKKVQEASPLAKVSTEHKELHATLSKFGKLIDKVTSIRQ